MNDGLYNSCKPIIDYNLNIKNNLLEICRPLFDNFDITYFEYAHISQNGQVFYLCTNQNWLEFSLENKMFDDKEHVEFCSIAKINKQRYVLWNGLDLEKTSLLSNYYEFNIWNGLTINEIEEHNFYTYSFATSINNKSINNFFINNFEVFDRFISYFKQKLNSLLSNKAVYLYATPLITDINKINSHKKNIEIFTDQTTIDKYLIIVDNNKIFLTKKDLLCLRMLASGKTMKEIGSQLGISARTVETHLNTIKNKTGLLFKGQLIDFFRKYFKYGF